LELTLAKIAVGKSARAMSLVGVVGTHMAKFLYSAAMSLDGVIAGPGGDGRSSRAESGLWTS
jgi:hypothetical protein